MGRRKSIVKSEAEQKHYNMSRIHSKDTNIEVLLRKALWHVGIRYRINYSALPGKPDIAITKYKIAIFCDGEFWHGRDWNTKKDKIMTNRDYWIPKIEKNMMRDSEVDKQLCALGWQVMRFWGRDIKKDIVGCVRDVQEMIFEVRIQEYEFDNTEDEEIM